MGAAAKRPPRGSEGVHVDAVLGLSMTPTSVGLVLVEGQDADGATMERDAFTVEDGAIPSAEQATAAVLRTEAMAATRGLRLHSIGVTWSEDADAQASMLMKSLSDSGFDNVVAIRMPQATEALARGIADVLGYATTAVCVIEPESVIVLIVNTGDGAVQTVFNHAVGCDEALISWLSTVFTRADWEPEALVVVGSARDFESILDRLEESLSVPVFAPEEAKLALARGAALASAQNIALPLDLFADDRDQGRSRMAEKLDQGGRDRRRTLTRVGPVALLAVGVVTFVVSVSIAVSLQLTPSREQPSSPVPAVNVETPPAVKAVPPVMPPPVAIPPVPVVEAALPPPPEAPPIVEAPPVAEVPDQAPVADVPAADPNYPPVEAAPVDPPAYVPPPMVGTPLPPPVYTAPVQPIPTKKPGILTRIKEKLTPGPG